jgi:hypothetical protein
MKPRLKIAAAQKSLHDFRMAVELLRHGDGTPQKNRPSQNRHGTIGQRLRAWRAIVALLFRMKDAPSRSLRSKFIYTGR